MGQRTASAAHLPGMTDLTPAELDRLMDLDTVADYIGISKQTLYKWRVSGKGPRAIKVGKHLRFRRRDVETWLDANYEAQ